jgi:hypothetical protein
MSGAYPATFTNAAGCDSVHTYNVTINPTYNTSTSVTSAFSYALPWGVTVTASGTYTNTYMTSKGCDSIVNFIVTIKGVRISAKVLLAGPLNTATAVMNDNLRAGTLIPTMEPYGTMNTSANPYSPVYTHVGGGGSEVIASAGVLSATGNDAIVDWVFLQLRTSATSGAVIATRSALVQRDGDIVDVDGLSPVEFGTVTPGSYFVSVKHRNHIGVMTNAALTLGATPTAIDYTSTSTALWTRPAPNNNPAPLSGATRPVGSVRALYAGNCNIADAARNALLTYNSTTVSDRAALLNACPGTSTLNGYSVFDVDMNGFARFNGLVPDRLVILLNLANSTTVIAYEQLP